MIVYVVCFTDRDDSQCHVCRVFARESDALVYIATANEWVTRLRAANDAAACELGKEYAVDPPTYENWLAYYRSNFGPHHRPELVDESKAGAELWPFGDDEYGYYFDLIESPFSP